MTNGAINKDDVLQKLLTRIDKDKKVANARVDGIERKYSQTI